MSDDHQDVRAELRRLQQEIEDLRRETMSLRRDDEARLHEIDQQFGAGAERARHVPGSHARDFRHHIIIPVHPPRFGTLVNAFSSVKDHASRAEDVLLVLVVTSDAERHMLENYIRLTGATFPVEIEIVSAIGICETLNLPQTLRSIRENKFSGIVNFKKMAAIFRSACLGAEDLLVIDSDVVFLGDIAEVFTRLRSNFDKKEIIAGKGPENIFSDSAHHLTEHDRNRIFSLFDDGKLYSWFFDAPYYPLLEAKTWLTHMAEAHGSIDAALARMKYGTFEHLLFHFHLALRHGFKVVDVRPIVGEWHLEDLPLPELLRIVDGTGHLPAWANLGGIITFSSPDDVMRARETFLIAMHVDRVASRMD